MKKCKTCQVLSISKLAVRASCPGPRFLGLFSSLSPWLSPCKLLSRGCRVCEAFLTLLKQVINVYSQKRWSKFIFFKQSLLDLSQETSSFSWAMRFFRVSFSSGVLQCFWLRWTSPHRSQPAGRFLGWWNLSFSSIPLFFWIPLSGLPWAQFAQQSFIFTLLPSSWRGVTIQNVR